MTIRRPAQRSEDDSQTAREQFAAIAERVIGRTQIALTRPGTDRHLSGDVAMTQMVRNAAFTLCVVLYSSITLHAADPALAPESWEGLRFGMTLQDAVAKLGTKAKHISAR